MPTAREPTTVPHFSSSLLLKSRRRMRAASVSPSHSPGMMARHSLGQARCSNVAVNAEMATFRTHLVAMNTIARRETIAVTLHKICTPFTFRWGEQIPGRVTSVSCAHAVPAQAHRCSHVRLNANSSIAAVIRSAAANAPFPHCMASNGIASVTPAVWQRQIAQALTAIFDKMPTGKPEPARLVFCRRSLGGEAPGGD